MMPVNRFAWFATWLSTALRRGSVTVCEARASCVPLRVAMDIRNISEKRESVALKMDILVFSAYLRRAISGGDSFVGLRRRFGRSARSSRLLRLRSHIGWPRGRVEGKLTIIRFIVESEF